MAQRYPEWIWHNGAIKPWAEATTHVMSHALHYGSSVFEGIRSYDDADGAGDLPPDRPHPAPVRVGEDLRHGDSVFAGASSTPRAAKCSRPTVLARHICAPSRSAASADSVCRPIRRPTSPSRPGRWGRISAQASSRRASTPACRAGSVSRPTRFRPAPRPAAIICPANWSRAKRGAWVSAKASRWPRPDCSAKARARTCSWSSTARCTRTPVSAALLNGITRNTLITLARDHGIEVVERDMPREYLYLCDELFMCGTAAEITPIRSVDGTPGRHRQARSADAAACRNCSSACSTARRRTSTAGSNRCKADSCLPLWRA